MVQLDVDGNHYPEIAKRLQIPLGTVCSRLHRAPNYGKKLAEYLPDAPHVGEGPDCEKSRIYQWEKT